MNSRILFHTADYWMLRIVKGEREPLPDVGACPKLWDRPDSLSTTLVVCARDAARRTPGQAAAVVRKPLPMGRIGERTR